MDLKKLQETAKEKGKVLLIEQINISNPLIQKPTQSQALVESSNGNQYKALAIVRNIPVTKFTENANGRIYPKQLWENVVRNKLAEGTYCLADHPIGDSDGSVKDIVGVWRNFKLKEERGLADLYLVGKLGQHFLETLEAGGANGLSSVGFGELLEDEKTVDPESYELLRLSDWVLNPSQGVYAKSDNIDYNSVNRLNESKITTNKKETKEVMDNITQLTIRNNIKQAFKESEKAIQGKGVSLIESKQDLKELLSYIPEEMQEARKQVTDRISLVESTLKEDLNNKTKSINVTMEKVKVLDNALTSLKEKHSKATRVIKLMSENEKGMKYDIKKLLEKAGLMYSDIKVFKEDYRKMTSDIKCFKEDRANMYSDIKKLVSERKQMLQDLKTNLQEKVDMTEDISILLEDRKKMVMDIKRLRKENKKLKEDSDVAETEITYPHGKDEEEVQEEEYGDEDYGLTVDPGMAYMADDPDMGLPSLASDYTDKLPESRKVFKKKMVKESTTKPVVKRKFNPDVIEYFESRVKQNKSLKSIKENVIRETSLVKAISMIESYLKSQNDKPISIRRSMNESSWVGQGY